MLPAGAPSTSACNDEVQVTAVDVGTGEDVGALVGATVDVGAAAGVGALLGGVVGIVAGCGVAALELGGPETGAVVPIDVAPGLATFADGDVDLAAAALDVGGGLLAAELACSNPPRAGGAMRAEGRSAGAPEVVGVTAREAVAVALERTFFA